MKKGLVIRLLIAGIGVPFLIAVLVFLPPLAIPITLSVITGISAAELLHAVNKPDRWYIYLAPVISAVVIPFGVYFRVGDIVFHVCLYIVTCAMFFMLMRGRSRKSTFKIPGALTGIFGGVITARFLSYLIDLRLAEHGPYLVMLPFIISMLSDTGGYFVGLTLGKHHPFPEISPKKSTEGCIGSVVFGVLFSVLYGVLVDSISPLQVNYVNFALLGLIVNPFVQFGDLVFSAIKREVGIKDFSRLLGEHGGMQDRFDSALFAAPVVWAVVNLLPVFA